MADKLTERLKKQLSSLGIAATDDNVAKMLSDPKYKDRLTALGVEASEVKEGRKPNTLVSTIKSNTCNIPTLFIQHLDS